MTVYEIIDRSTHKPVRLVLADRIKVVRQGTIFEDKRTVWFFWHDVRVDMITNGYDFAECDRWLTTIDKEAATWMQ